MAVAPEPYLSACLEVLSRAIVWSRAGHESGDIANEQAADLMDAVHNIPWLIHNWEKCDIELLRTAFLRAYEQKWLSRGGLALCQIFDETVAQKGNSVLLVEIAPGELFDKLTILEIKSERIADAEKLKHVRAELAVLAAARETLEMAPEVADLVAQLKSVNAALWEIEDAIRLCEREQDFGPRFVELARSVYLTNDRRAALKRVLNAHFRSPLAEEKLYTDYGK